MVGSKGQGLAVPLTVGSSVVGSAYPLSAGGVDGSYTDSKSALPLSPVGGTVAGAPGLGLGLGFLTPPRISVPSIPTEEEVGAPAPVDESFLNQVGHFKNCRTPSYFHTDIHLHTHRHMRCHTRPRKHSRIHPFVAFSLLPNLMNTYHSPFVPLTHCLFFSVSTL